MKKLSLLFVLASYFVVAGNTNCNPQNDLSCFANNTSINNDSSCEDRKSTSEDVRTCSLATNSSCNVDADCVIVDTLGTGCMGGCAQALNANAAQDYLNTIDAINGLYCEDYIQDGCNFAGPRCANPALMTAVCNAGTCEAQL